MVLIRSWKVDRRSHYSRYCELDTWAMVKVWEKLKEVAE